MKINDLESNVSQNFIKLILDAQQADSDKLKLLRKEFIKNLDKIGAKNFVTVMADILKNKFCLEGCNDVRMPLKQIFAIPLEDLEEELSKKEYDLPRGHPVVMLSEDHKDNIKRLKALRFCLGGLNLNKDTTPGAIKNKLKQVQDYYVELDLHIRKEEEMLFPVLEENGIQEHPRNLLEFITDTNEWEIIKKGFKGIK